MASAARKVAFESGTIKGKYKEYIGFVCVLYAEADWGVGEARSCLISERGEDELGEVSSRLQCNLR